MVFVNLYYNNIVINYKTMSCGYVSAFIKGLFDDFVLFKDKKEFYGSGRIYISSNRINSWIQESNSLELDEVILLLTHVSCRNNRYSQEITPLNFNISAPYGYNLLKYPDKPNLLSTNLTK